MPVHVQDGGDRMTPPRYDRFGDRLDDDELEPETLPVHRCENGYLGPDDNDVVQVCPVCRPDLAARLTRQHLRDWTEPTRRTA
jgi:hypothetical protein